VDDPIARPRALSASDGYLQRFHKLPFLTGPGMGFALGEGMAVAALLVRPTHLEGELSQEGLIRILRSIFLGRLTGQLGFARRADRFALRFLGGQIVSASSSAITGRLGSILVRIGLLETDDLERALGRAHDAERALGPVLVELGFVRREQVEEALRLQVREILFTALFWGSGSYRFAPDEGTVGPREEVTLRLSTAQVIFEVVGAMTDHEAVRRALGDVERAVSAAADPPVRIERVTLSPGDGYVVSRADGSLSASEILAISPLPAEIVERSLLGLVCTGIIQLLPRTARRARALSPVAPAVESTPAEAAPDADARRREIAELFAALAGKNHYEMLGLAPGAQTEEIKTAYLRLVKRFHPDAVGDAGEQAAAVRAIFHRICEAYTVLRNPASRAREEQRLVANPKPAVAATMVAAPPAPAPAPEAEAPCRFPDTGEALKQAEECLKKGMAWEAATLLQDAIPHAKGALRAHARILMARALLKSPSGVRSAEAELRGLLDEAPLCLDACLALGAIYKDTGRTLRAAAMFRKALEIDPGQRLAEAELKSLPVAEEGPTSLFRRFRPVAG